MVNIFYKMCPSKSWRKSRKSNITCCLLKRQQCRLSYEEQRTILRYGVSQTTHSRRAISCKFSGSPISTFFLAFSPDGETVASSHGDHSVRINKVKSGRCLHILKGHPRSVWCLAFHPSHPYLLASGCLKGVVNIWDLRKGNSKLIGSLNCHKVTSLAFHPRDMVLLVAKGNQLVFWSWQEEESFPMVESPSVDEKIRLVKFDSLGHHILTGILDTVPVDASMDEADCQTRKNPWVSKTSVVCVNVQNMETTVDHRTEETMAERSRRGTTSSQNPEFFRLQWWDFTRLEIPNLQQTNLNVVARNCKLYNNMSADISADGRLLSALVTKLENCTELCKVCVFSLEKYNLGQCLFSTVLGCNTFSTCFSPLGTHIIVGIACGNGFALFQDDAEDRTVAYIFKLCEETNFPSEVATLKLRASGEGQFSNLRANAVVWHPIIGYGLIAFGTNEGGVYFCHV